MSKKGNNLEIKRKEVRRGCMVKKGSKDRIQFVKKK